MKNGIYYWPIADKIVLISEVRNYEDLWRSFSIVTWQEKIGICYSRTLIYSEKLDSLVFLGRL